MEHYNVLVQTGYAEDQQNSWLWMNYSSEKARNNRQIFEDLREALVACADERASSIESERQRKHRDCKLSDGPWCSYCGLPNQQEWEEQAEQRIEAAEILRELASGDCNSVSCEVMETLEEHGWTIWGEPLNGRMVFLRVADRGIEEDYEHFPEISSKRVTFK
jgi:hypothetical protein